MIATVCLNPCIDKTVSISSFVYGGMNRIIEKREDGSGKGINVAIAARRIGCEAAALGFMYQDNYAPIEARLKAEQVPFEFVWCQGAVRTNTKVLDLEKSIITEINESGTPVTDKNIEDMKASVREWSQKADLMVFSGSVPAGCGTQIYRELMAATRPGTRCILDTEGDRLLEGLKENPYLIKPNTFELETIVGCSLQTPREVYQAATTLVDRGAKLVAVSMGGDGALITDGGACYYSEALKVAVKSTVGAGDSMVAAFCKAIENGLSLEDIFRYGVAGGTAGVMTEGTELIRSQDFEQVMGQVKVQKIA